MLCSCAGSLALAARSGSGKILIQEFALRFPSLKLLFRIPSLKPKPHSRHHASIVSNDQELSVLN